MKKFLSLVLALVMTMSLVTISAGAKVFEDDAAIDYSEAVEVMKAIKVIDGYADGSFNPTAQLTRGAAAKIICNMLLGPTTASALPTNAAPFKDVPAGSTFAGYIAYCSMQGIVSGYADGTFRPAAPLTVHAFMKMLLTSLGYDQDVEGYTGPNFGVAVAKRALNVGLDEGFEGALDGTKVVTREEACLFALNALKADMVDYSSKGTSISINGATIATGASKAEVVKASEVNAADGNIDNNGVKATADGVAQFAEVYFKDLVLDTNGTDELGRPANEWIFKGDSVGVYGEKADFVVALDKNYSNATKLEEGLQKLTGNKKLDLNGKAPATYKVADVFEIYVDGNKVTKIVPYSYEIDKIDDVDTDVSKKDAEDGITAYVTFENNGTINDDDIPGFAAKTYVEDAFVILLKGTDSKGNTVIVESCIAKTVDGALDSYKLDSEDVVTIGGKKMTKSNGYDASLSDVSAMTSLKAGDKYTAYVDPNGFVMAIVAEGAEATKIEDVYFLSKVWGEKTNKYGNQNITSYYAQLVAMDGSVKEIELEEKQSTSLTLVYDAQANNGSITGLTAGVLVKISDKQVKDAANKEICKKGDGLFNVKVWATDNDWDAFSATVAKFEKDTTRAVVGGTAYRLNADTQYVLVSKSADKGMKVAVKVGGINYTPAASDIVTFITEDGKTVVKYVVIASTAKIEEATEYSEDLLFIAKVDYAIGKDCFIQDVYFKDGSKQTVKVSDVEGDAIAVGFFKYTVNDDGMYELEDDVDALKVTAGVWEDEEGVVSAAIFSDLFENLLTVSGVADINVKGAKFVDTHSTSAKGAYESSVSSLAKLESLVNGDHPKAKNAVLYINVAETGAVTVFMTSLAAV